VIAEVFRRAGVTDVNAGTRLLRHSAASRLLRAAVPLPTISAVSSRHSESALTLLAAGSRWRSS
jgi:hypothetical protein